MNNAQKSVAKVICKKIPVDWIRFDMYFQDDIYRTIPMLVFRVKESCSENMILELIKCVEAFEGKVKWKMFRDPLSKSGNFVLTIAKMEDLHNKCNKGQIDYNQKLYFGITTYNKYCECAIEDIPLLAEYIDNKWL